MQQQLTTRTRCGSLRKLTAATAGSDFCSNDYLGYARHALLKQRIKEASLDLAYGSTSSRLVRGHRELTDQVEQRIAEFHQSPCALIYNSGYDANLGFWSCIPQRGDLVIFDEYIHASIRDGIRLSFARHASFKHNSLDHLEERLKSAKGLIYVAIESVYSMGGALAPLKEVQQLCADYGARLVVDEAHATGVVGERGQGLVQTANLQEQTFARVHTFGKALGCHGSAILGSQALKDYLINFSRPLIYTTALPPHSLMAIDCAYHFLDENPQHVNELNLTIDYFTHQADHPSFIKSPSPIQGFKTPGNHAVLDLANRLQQQGLDVRPMRHPTVPLGSEQIRICLHRFNTRQEINHLLQCLMREVKQP